MTPDSRAEVLAASAAKREPASPTKPPSNRAFVVLPGFMCLERVDPFSISAGDIGSFGGLAIGL
jgi:hypothetical protein